jgi:hypothetical protein
MISRLGVGATPPKELDTSLKRRDTSSLVALRKQLLGRNATRANTIKRDTEMPTKPTTKSALRLPDSESDDEGGRASAFTSRTKKPKARIVLETKEPDLKEIESDGDEVQKVPAPKVDRPGKRKATSFLDEVLAEKAGKKKGKKKKKSAAE